MQNVLVLEKEAISSIPGLMKLTSNNPTVNSTNSNGSRKRYNAKCLLNIFLSLLLRSCETKLFKTKHGRYDGLN